MNIENLDHLIRTKRNFLCVGLDSDINRIPSEFNDFERPCLAFNKMVIDATRTHCVAYKLNTAFYESRGQQGWLDMEDTLLYIGNDHFTIADAKRGDIGNTAEAYAKAFFRYLNFDSVTVNPYMGYDTIEPYAGYDNKTIIVLGLTSNSGSDHIQKQVLLSGKALYEKLITDLISIYNHDSLMFVIGATQEEQMSHIRSLSPDHYFLVPGIGVQGGDISLVYKKLARNDGRGILVNSSRSIIFAPQMQKSMTVDDAAKQLSTWMDKTMSAPKFQ